MVKDMHKHHIIPKHMGGTDDPENLVELTIEEHAEAHRKLFEEYGCWQDEIAWKGLAKMIEKSEIIRRVQSEAGKERIRKKGNPFTSTHTQYNFKINDEFRKKISALANTPEAIAKKRKTMSENNHQKGEKNSQFGMKWCVEENAKNLNLRKKFKEPPKGWITTTEWKDRRKDKNNNAYGRHWYNDGVKNFYLKETDPMINHLIRGRLMVVN